MEAQAVNDDKIVVVFRVMAVCILVGLVIGVLQYSRQMLAAVQQILEVLP